MSHAVGCAFTICLEKKQQREKEKLSLTISSTMLSTDNSQSQRTGSFRQTTLAERLTDPQSAIVAGKINAIAAKIIFIVARKMKYFWYFFSTCI